jgi:hypothetical protein
MSLSKLDVLYKIESSFHNEFRVNSQQLLIINFIIFAVLVLFFLLGRSKHKQNTTLNLKSQPEKSKEENLAEPRAVQVTPVPEIQRQAKIATQIQPEPSQARDVTPKNPKEVVYFMFNGHEWEAHEVLGIKSGSGIDQVTKHYQHLIKTSDPSTFEFYDAAFTAILKLKGNRW